MEEEDKQCSYIHEEPHPKAGERCKGFHVKGSPFCTGHSEQIARTNEQRSRRAEEARDFKQGLELDYHDTCTPEGVQKLTEKVINGILRGFIKKDKSALGVLLPFAYKMAKEQRPTSTRGEAFRIDLEKTTQSLTVNMTEEQMDKYLAAPENVRIEILEDLQKDGNLSKGERTVKIDASKTDPKKIRVDGAGLEEISKHTDQPITKKQAYNLFGKNMADKAKTKPGPDTRGFGDLFEKERGKPTGLPEGALHKWKGKYEPEPGSDPPVAKLWFTCEQCGTKKPNVDNKELCPAGGQPPTADEVQRIQALREQKSGD